MMVGNFEAEGTKLMIMVTLRQLSTWKILQSDSYGQIQIQTLIILPLISDSWNL